MLEQLGLYVTGNISTDSIQNFELFVSGETDPIAMVDGVNSKDVALLVMDEAYKINKGDTKSFTVKADLNTGRTDDTLKIYVDENTDVVAIGAKYGFGMTVTRTTYDGGSCTTTSGDCTYSALEGGDITISSSGPAASDIAVNSKDVVLMNFSIASVSDITFKNFEISLTTSGSSADLGLINSDAAANLTDIKIINTETGKALMGPVDSTAFVATSGGAAIDETTDDGESFYRFTDEFSMETGDTLKLAVTADVKNDTDLANMTVVSELQVTSSLPEIRDANNKVVTNTSSLVPSSEIAGKTMTIKSAGLTFGLSSSPVSDTYVKGTKNVKFACFSAQAGQSSSIKLTALTLGTSFDEDGGGFLTTGVDTTADPDVYANSVVGSVKLVDGSGKVIAPTKSVTSAGVVVFDNMTHVITAGNTDLICVEGDISSDAFKNSSDDRIAFGITGTSSVTAEDKNGNTLAAAQIAGLAVNGTPSNIVTVSGGGSLTVAVDASTAKENIVVSGTTGVTLSKFKFTSTDEAFVVKKLSVNNKQSSIANASLGNYDNNVAKVGLSYKDSTGATKTTSGYLTGGSANFSGLDIYVPKDEDVVVTVTADVNGIANGGATAAEFIELNIAFNDFEATAQGSGETYKGSKIDASVAAASDLDFGTPAFTTGGAMELDAAVLVGAVTAGSALTIEVDNATAAPSNRLPVGALICVDEADNDVNGAACTENILVVTASYVCTAAAAPHASCADANEHVYETVILEDSAGAMADADDLTYSLPGLGYLTSTNVLHVYESKPALALSSSSPSGNRNVDTTDQPFVFSITETGGKEKVQFRMSEINAATASTTDWTSNTALNGTFTGTDALTTVSTGGIGNSAYQRETSGGTNAASIIYTFASAADLSGFSGISFWSKASTTANTLTLTIDDSAGTDQTVATSTGTAATWEFTDLSFVGTTSTDLDVIATLTWAVTDASAENAATYDVDEVTLYYDKIVVTGTSDSDFDTNTTGGADNLVATLRDGSTTELQGYWYSSTQGANSGTISATLYPLDSDFEVSKGGSTTLALQTSTTSLLDEDAGVDDPVTFSIALGSSTTSAFTTTVSAGGIFWYDTNALVRWLGDVSNTTFNSNTIKY